MVLSPSDDPSSAIMVAVEAGEPLFLASAVGTRLFFAPTTDAVPGVDDPSGYARAAIGCMISVFFLCAGGSAVSAGATAFGRPG